MNRKNKSVLIISYSKLNSDPRVLRQIRALKDDYDIITAGLSSSGINGVGFSPIEVFVNTSILARFKRLLYLIFRLYNRYYWDPVRIESFKMLDKLKFDVVIANDIETLPLALRLKKTHQAAVQFDAHEYYPGENGISLRNLKWSFFLRSYTSFLCKKYLSLVDSFISVSDGVADLFEKKFGRRPVIITNATEFVDLEPVPVDKNKIKMIHHGASSRERKIEVMIELMKSLDERISLDLMLMPTDKAYLEELKIMAKKVANVRLINPVSYDKIVPFINQYDIGIFILPFTNLNYTNALPNKLFEFIQARLAIAIGPSPEMARLVKKYNLGVVANNFSIEAMTKKLNSLTPDDIMEFKKNSHNCARELSFESNRDQYRHLIQEIITH